MTTAIMTQKIRRAAVLACLGLGVQLAAAFCACLFIVAPLTLRAQGNTGTITGRILNEGTGQYLRSAIVTVVGTSISTLAESAGLH